MEVVVLSRILNRLKPSLLNKDNILTVIEKIETNENITQEYLFLGIFENKLAKLIEISTRDFIKKSYVFSTTEDNQKQLLIKLFRGEKEEQSLAKYLGQYQIINIPNLPAEIPKVEISFICDNGIIGMFAKELTLNIKLEIVKKDNN